MHAALAKDVAAAHPTCNKNGWQLSIGEEVYISDKDMLEQAAKEIAAKGVPAEQAKRLAAKDDWVGFRLTCQRQFRITEDGQMQQLDSGVLVLVDHQRDWYANVQRERAN
jgi:hypothetical protein